MKEFLGLGAAIGECTILADVRWSSRLRSLLNPIIGLPGKRFDSSSTCWIMFQLSLINFYKSGIFELKVETIVGLSLFFSLTDKGWSCEKELAL